MVSPTNRKNPRRITLHPHGSLRDGPLFETGYGLIEWVKQFNQKRRGAPKGPRGPKLPKHLAGAHTHSKKPYYWPSVKESPMPPAALLDPLLHRIEAALIASGESQTRFGVLAANDGALVSRMRRGLHVKKPARRKAIEDRIEMLMQRAGERA